MVRIIIEAKGNTLEQALRDAEESIKLYHHKETVIESIEQLNDLVDARTETFTQPEKTPEEKTNEAITKTPVQSPTYDSAGFPWDARIHADSKELNRDGTWRRRRKLDEAFIKSVEAELKGLTPQQEKSEPIKDATVQTTVPVPSVPGIPSQVTLTPPPVSVPVSQPVNKYAHTYLSFRKHFTETLASLVIDKKITQEYIDQLKQYFEVKEIFDIVQDSTKLDELFKNFVAAGLITELP